MTRRSFGMLLTAVCLLSAGCMTTDYNSDRGAYRLNRHLNRWQTTVGMPIADVHAAARKGVRDLQLVPITDRVDSITAVLDGTLADGSDFEIDLEALSSTATRIAIRCGLHGDRDRSLQLFRAIEANF